MLIFDAVKKDKDRMDELNKLLETVSGIKGFLLSSYADHTSHFDSSSVLH